jgi:hypothetical protein
LSGTRTLTKNLLHLILDNDCCFGSFKLWLWVHIAYPANGSLMQIVPPRYLVPQGRHVIVAALTPIMQSWCAETLAEPVPEELAAILRRLVTMEERLQ